MAALIRHGSLASSFKSTSALLVPSTKSARFEIARTKTKVKPVEYPNLEATRQSLSAKGFLRPLKEYTPSNNVADIIESVCKQHNVPTHSDTKLDDLDLRYKILAGCGDQLKHYVPNSLLYTIETLGDVKNFYKTPVDAVTPYDAMKTMDLPKNLHVQYDYVRFHPETDTMFGGKTAFPKSSTLVTGLKYKKKYRGHSQPNPFRELMLKY